MTTNRIDVHISTESIVDASGIRKLPDDHERHESERRNKKKVIVYIGVTKDIIYLTREGSKGPVLLCSRCYLVVVFVLSSSLMAI